MFKTIYIILGVILFIVLVILLVKLVQMGKHAAVIAEKVEEMPPKIEYITKQAEELQATTQRIQEFNEQYMPTIGAALSIASLYRSIKKNIKKKKSKSKTLLKNLMLVTKPNSIESYRTLIRLFK